VLPDGETLGAFELEERPARRPVVDRGGHEPLLRVVGRIEAEDRQRAYEVLLVEDV